MNKKTTITIVFMAITICCYATSKIYSGKPIPIRTVKDKWQFIEKNQPLIANLEQAPIVVYYDDVNHSLLFTINGSTDPDSVLYQIKPGDLFSARVSANVNWNDEIQRYQYEYEIESLPVSKIPIKRVTIRLGFNPLQVLSPKGWDLNQGVGYTGWSQWRAKPFTPGNSVSGFGYESAGPPVIKEIELSGEMSIVISREWDEDPDIPSFLANTENVKCLTIVPGPSHEKIEANKWVSQINNSLGKLVSNGYIPSMQRMEVRSILNNLYDAFKDTINTTFDKWNPLVNQTLDALSPYQSQIEPEAWSYITENLKYMQRHKDIVWFGK